LDYQSIPSNCRTNNFLENYNGYIKTHLGKNRYINWVNFIHFIKTESQRNLNKLHENANLNILTLKKNEDKNIIKDMKTKKDNINFNNDNDIDTNENNEKDEEKRISMILKILILF
jgi:hypothetical protein